MNGTPDKNNYTDYNLDGTQVSQNRSYNAQRPKNVQQTQSRQQTSAHTQSNQNYSQAQRRTASNVNQIPQTQRRPLNDEDRRRLEAARMAAMQNSGRAGDEEFRRRRMEQQRLNSAQPQSNVRTTPRPQNPDSYNRQMPPQQARRKRKRVKLNAGAIIFVLLIAGVIGVSVNQIGKNEENPLTDSNITAQLPKADKDESYDFTAPSVGETDDISDEISESDVESTEINDAAINLTLYDNKTVSNTSVDEGDLILVNYQYAYADTDTISLANVYDNRTSPVKVSTTAISMKKDALEALDALHNGLIAETGCDDLLIVSGHRTVAEQQSVYDGYLASNGQEYVDQYVATPTFSEHHTGLACDLSFFTDEGYSVPISDHEFGYWLGENCAKYGYVRRYPEDKVDITKISYEAWHFRYVGVPHANAMTTLDYCLEEYVDYIKGYTADTKLLHILSDGTVADVDVTADIPMSDGWLVYYAPMTEGDTTDIKLLRGDAYLNYDISGNNVDGYIVTVTLP